MRVPIFDLRVTEDKLKEELLSAVGGVLDHGRLILGPEVEAFEAAVAESVSSKYAVGVASGSSAVYLALQAAGIRPGDEVITSPLTWIITYNAIASCGAIPVSVDIREDFNIDPDSIESAITEKTKGIVPIHFTGLMCDMDRICDIAEKNDLVVVEDAAQAFGAEYKGRQAGFFSKAAGFSMNPMKILAGYGEAGAVTTDDPAVNETVRMLRYAGTKSDPEKIITNECYHVSLNHKMDTTQAAMLLVAMKRLPAIVERRTEIARGYTNALKDVVRCPLVADDSKHAYFTYAIQTERRNQLKEFLEKQEIETKIYHLPLASEAPVYQGCKRGETPVAKRVLDNFLSIPCHEKLNDDQIDFVIEKVLAFFEK